MEREIYEADKLNILDCKKLNFKIEKSGYLTLETEGKTYKKVIAARLQPFYTKTKYISLSYENEDKELREIGVIKDMSELSADMYALLDGYLEYKYFMPEILKVYSIKDNMRGSIFVKADTTSGTKTLCIKDWYQNFRLISGNYLYVNDADGNKYFAPDIEKLDKKSRLLLEMFI
jgi:hypothetical protein